MADTRDTTIEETFGLIAVEEYGGKVRLYTPTSCGRGYTRKLALAAASAGPKAR